VPIVQVKRVGVANSGADNPQVFGRMKQTGVPALPVGQ